MDLESGRDIPVAREIEIPQHTAAYDTVRFAAMPERASRILRLARESNPKNALPDKLCGFGTALFFALALAGLLVWGVVYNNATLILAFWAVASVFIALPVLITLYVRQSFGMASRFHKFYNPVLTLASDRLVLEMKRHMLFRGKHSPTIRREVLFSRVTALEYDRSSKTLRIISAQAAGEKPSLEIVMVYDNSDQIIRDIEQRCKVFIHPAMRGDDYADLRDLSGLKRERALLRPLSFAVLLFTLISLLSALAIRSHNNRHPYTPYPQTAEEFLTGTFTVGDTVTLDGCEFTLNSVSRAGSDTRGVCYQFLTSVHNLNTSSVRLRVDEKYRDSGSNISFFGFTQDGRKLTLEMTQPPLGYAGIELPCPGYLSAGKTATITFFVWVPENAERVEMTINSDYWPPGDILRDVTYTGSYVLIGGRSVKSNEVRFTVERFGE